MLVQRLLRYLLFLRNFCRLTSFLRLSYPSVGAPLGSLRSQNFLVIRSLLSPLNFMILDGLGVVVLRVGIIAKPGPASIGRRFPDPPYGELVAHGSVELRSPEPVRFLCRKPRNLRPVLQSYLGSRRRVALIGRF